MIKQVRADVWGAVRYHYVHQTTDQALMGLIANNVHSHGTVMLTFSPLQEKDNLVLRAYSRMQQPDLIVQAEILETLESPSASLYVYKVVDVDEWEAEVVEGVVDEQMV